MRTIDADVLKEIIGECPENWTDSPEEVAEFNMWHRIMDDIDSTSTICEWVSIKDRLPEFGRFVVIRIDPSPSYPSYYIACIRDSSIDAFYDGNSPYDYYNDYITHWMYLPEPPEEVSVHD